MILGARDAYRQWAEHYDDETVVTVIENATADHLTPPLEGVDLLDAGCGTGRRLPATASCRAIGVDLVPAMLGAGQRARRGVQLAAADLRALPVAGRAFDIVWCRLVVGHVPTLSPVYSELARVVRRRGSIIVTDFHPDAVAAGHLRTFHDAAGTLHEVEHHTHGPDDHLRAAASAGLRLAERFDGVVGPAVEALYARAGRPERYARDQGLPLVLAFRFTP